MMIAGNSRPVEGILWTFASGVFFIAVNIGVKYLGPVMPAAEAAFLRYALGLVLLIPLYRQIIAIRPTRSEWGFYVLRGALHAIGVALWFHAMARIPLADVTAMGYLAPVYVTIGAAVFLGEKLAFRRIIAVISALSGALIILRPGFREIEPGHVSMLLAAIAFAGSHLVAKHLADRAPPITVVTMLSVWVTIGLLPMTIPVWVAPETEHLLILFGVAAFATIGHYLMTLGLKAAPITVTQPVTFLQLVWAVSLGVILFGEPVDPWVIMGGALIIAAISFITWREARVAKKSITPPAPATKL
jgi:drug/metabolite transporter (DMT)-like permease